MINPQQFAPACAFLHKNVQEKGLPLSAIPETAIFADVLKTLETRLQLKGLLDSVRCSAFNPVWFLVETERNVFLWRCGYSLSQQSDFEFWVDVPRLIRKRLVQLEASDATNPFVNPLWEQEHGQNSRNLTKTLEQETAYLRSFLEAAAKIMLHAHALSQVASLLAQELNGCEKPRVLLPYQIKG